MLLYQSKRPRRNPKKGKASSHGGKVVITKDHLIVVVIVVLREQAPLAEEVVGLDNHGLADLEGEDTLVGIRLHPASAQVLARGEDLAVEDRERGLQPFLAGELALLRLRHVSNH